jgi:formamidopyrimidine-DNA glycosylase
VPELPEVHALVTDLGARLRGRTVDTLAIVSFAALKTFDPAPSALRGKTVTDVTRHGKFLDLLVGDVHVIIHLARAGWIRWRDSAPGGTGRPGKGPLAARLVLDDGAGFDVTEAGTK